MHCISIVKTADWRCAGKQLWKETPQNKLCYVKFPLPCKGLNIRLLLFIMFILQTFDRIGTNFVFLYSHSWVPDTQQGLGQEFGCHRSAMNLMGWVEIVQFYQHWVTEYKMKDWKLFLYELSVCSSLTSILENHQQYDHNQYTVLTITIHLFRSNKTDSTPNGLFWIVLYTHIVIYTLSKTFLMVTLHWLGNLMEENSFVFSKVSSMEIWVLIVCWTF